ncbi:MAG: sensor histidine kinase [Desulfosalsimonas sp.]
MAGKHRLYSEKSREQLIAELDGIRSELAAEKQRYQNLSAELIDTEERERRRIARFLHDDLQQILAAAMLQVQSVSETNPCGAVLANVARLLKECIDKSRSLSHELSPALLHHSGLVPGLEWLARNMEEKFGLCVQLEVKTSFRIEHSALKVFLYRAIRELLFNTVKHAGVKNARVVLAGTDEGVFVTISDNGRGFEPGQAHASAANAGSGLLCLRERARSVGGDLKIESSPGHGSRFTLSFPASLFK